MLSKPCVCRFLTPLTPCYCFRQHRKYADYHKSIYWLVWVVHINLACGIDNPVLWNGQAEHFTLIRHANKLAN